MARPALPAAAAVVLALLAPMGAATRPQRHSALRAALAERPRPAPPAAPKASGGAATSKWNWEALTDIGGLHQLVFAEQAKDPKFSDAVCKQAAQAKRPSPGCAAVCQRAKAIRKKWGDGGTGPYAEDMLRSYGCA